MQDMSGFGGGIDPTEARLRMRLDMLNDSLQRAEAREALVEEAKRIQHQRHVAGLHRLVAQVEAALGKAREGSYGKCDSCGQDIASQDLAHEPASTLCASCRGHDQTAA